MVIMSPEEVKSLMTQVLADLKIEVEATHATDTDNSDYLKVIVNLVLDGKTIVTTVSQENWWPT